MAVQWGSGARKVDNCWRIGRQHKIQATLEKLELAFLGCLSLPFHWESVPVRKKQRKRHKNLHFLSKILKAVKLSNIKIIH